MEERIKILEMLSEGTITVSEATQLLDTLDNQKLVVESKAGKEEFLMSDVVKAQVGKSLHIKVISNDGDKVNINLPLAFIKAAIKLGKAEDLFTKSIKTNDAEILKQIDLDVIIGSIEHGMTGKIVDVKSADGDLVEIYID